MKLLVLSTDTTIKSSNKDDCTAFSKVLRKAAELYETTDTTIKSSNKDDCTAFSKVLRKAAELYDFGVALK